MRTEATGGMLAERTPLSCVEESRELVGGAVGREAELDEAVAVQLAQGVARKARAQVQAIAILRDEVRDERVVFEGAQGHVRVGGRALGKVGRPHSYALGQTGPQALGAPVVGNAGGGADARSRVHDTRALRRHNHPRQLLTLGLHLLLRVHVDLGVVGAGEGTLGPRSLDMPHQCVALGEEGELLVAPLLDTLLHDAAHHTNLGRLLSLRDAPLFMAV